MQFGGSPLGDTYSGRDDVVQRGAYPVTFRVFYYDTVVNKWDELIHEPNKNKTFLSTEDALNDEYIVQCEMEVNEPILGLAPMEAFSASESGLFGVRTFELKLGLNDCKNI